jgi:hypothetical protein
VELTKPDVPHNLMRLTHGAEIAASRFYVKSIPVKRVGDSPLAHIVWIRTFGVNGGERVKLAVLARGLPYALFHYETG